jgi:membrane protease YdiL (CAAX protease family)
VRELATKLPTAWFGNLVVAGIVFSIVNAVLEELVFRGMLWNIITEE